MARKTFFDELPPMRWLMVASGEYITVRPESRTRRQRSTSSMLKK
jgi:hypothetical protein